MKYPLIAALLMGLTLAIPALSADPDQKGAPAAARAQGPLSEGEVRKIDKDARKITLRHGPIENLDMPAMTMVFQVADAAVLEHVKAGDKVRFRAEKNGSQYTVTRIEPLQ